MSHSNSHTGVNVRAGGIRTSDVDRLLNAFRALDRAVVETSMHIYKLSHRDRNALRKQHRSLHNTIRQHLVRVLP
jgi:hypothetical protein